MDMNFNELQEPAQNIQSVEQKENPFQKRLQEREQINHNRNVFESRQQERTLEKYPYDEEGDLDREIERNQARLLSRGIETVAGLPGDIQSLISSMTGHEFETQFPTSEKLQEKSEEYSQGYTKAKGEHEQRADDLMKSVAAFALPGGSGYSLARNIGIPIAGELVKEGIKKSAPGKEKSAEFAKIGTMLMLDLMGNRIAKGGARDLASKLFQESEAMVPEGTMMPAANFEKSLNTLEKTLKKGGSAPSTQAAISKIDELKSLVNNGKIDASDLLQARKRINEVILKEGGFDFTVPKEIKKRITHNLNDVKRSVINGLEEYGATQNPEFLKLNQQANEVYSALENSNKISNFIQSNFGDKFSSVGAKLLFNTAGVGGLGTAAYVAPATTAIAAGSVPLYLTFKVLNRVKNSPTLRKHYFDIVNSSLKGNAGQMTKSMHLLDKELSKDEKSKRKKS